MSPESKGKDKNREELKAVDMPERAEMEQKLREAKLLGTTPQTDRFFRRFVESVAGSSKVGPGLNMAWELAAYDTLGDYPPMIKALVDMSYDQVIDAVTPDPKVASQAKEFRKQMLEELKQKSQKEKK